MISQTVKELIWEYEYKLSWKCKFQGIVRVVAWRQKVGAQIFFREKWKAKAKVAAARNCVKYGITEGAYDMMHFVELLSYC